MRRPFLDARVLLICLLVSATGCPQPDSSNLNEAPFQTTASGLQYRIRREGDGRRPQPRDVVQLRYRGWLDDGEVFADNLGDRFGQALKVSELFEGLREGVMLIRTGGAIELIIPAELGHRGKEFKPLVPPDARLHFLVEITHISPG